MSEHVVCSLPCDLVVREGTGKATGKPYRMIILRVLTNFGLCDIVLDTRNDRTGIVLDIVARKEDSAHE